MTWNQIYDAAIDKTFLEPELVRKDRARSSVVFFVYDNFGFNLETEYINGLINCVEDYIEEYVEKYNIFFDDSGNIDECSEVTVEDKAYELVEFYYSLKDRPNKDADTLPIAMEILKEMCR